MAEPRRLGVLSSPVRKGLAQLVAIGVLVTVLVTLVAVLFKWLPTSASEQFNRIQDVYWFVTIISIGIFSLVTSVIIFSVWKFRVPLDDDADGPPIHGHTGLEILWTAVPAALVIAIGIVSAFVLARNGEAGNDPLQVHVIGQQFTWKFQYPQYGNLTSGELVLPLGRQTKFTMTSVDVIHSFWVPQFGQKQDAVPGIETTILVTPTRTGHFAVVCTELCGLGHATMRAKALVAFPGGYGTFDELFETLTLAQTAKVDPLPVILFGRDYWGKAISWKFLEDEGMISLGDLDLFRYAETAQEAWDLITRFHRDGGWPSSAP